MVPSESDELGLDPESECFLIFRFGDRFLLGLFVDGLGHEIVDKNILNLIY